MWRLCSRAVNRNILVCLWIVASTRESSKITMKVQHDAMPEDVIAESIRRKIRTMNVSVEQQQKCVTTHVTSYVLKVCGCEDFLLGNHPISQYKVRVCMWIVLFNTLTPPSPSLRFNGHFPGEPGLAVVY